MNDDLYMSQALVLAQKGIYSTTPNPRVGCVLVKDQQIIGQGWHQKAGQPHAEIHALNDAKSRANDVCGATAYVTLEPCSHFGKTPPCCDALIRAQISRVVIAMSDPNPQVAGKGIERLTQAGIHVRVGVQEQAARRLNRGFIKRMEQKRPFVCCKMAQSLDGQTALASGASQWITAAAAREDVQRLRAQSCAVMTGIGTVLADNPSMNVRSARYSGDRQPARIILDSHLKLPLASKIISSDAQVIVFCSHQAASTQKKQQLQDQGVEICAVDSNLKSLDLDQIMHHLVDFQFNEILLESGQTLSGSMISEQMVDELVLYQAPKLMGSGGRGSFSLPRIKTMDDSLPLDIKDIRMVGKDLRITAGFDWSFE